MPATFDEIRALEDAHQLKTYAKYPLAVERAQGVYVFDPAGRRYLDFYGGHAVVSTGHCHPRVVAAVQEQAAKCLFYSNVVYSGVRAEAARALASVAPGTVKHVFFCNSGAEANETALKMARKHTGRPTILAMRGGFHGRTLGALSVTGIESYRTMLPPTEGVRFAEFGDLGEAEREAAAGDLAGVILEPVQSMRGVRMAEPGYYQGLRRLCDRTGAVLIFDEVQTGMGRTGAFFFGEHVGVVPDLITLAKGIASGVPMGAVLVAESIAERIQQGEHGTTFGGGPVACAAAKATVEVMLAERLPERAREMGRYLMERLQGGGINGFVRVRGLGLLLGVEFDRPVKPLVSAMLDRGILVGGSHDPKTTRLLPPLVVGREHCDELVAALRDAAAEALTA